MAMVTGGQLVARMLKEERVRHVFTLSGLHVAPIYAGLVEEGIEVVDTRHEQGAAHAADAYARITRGVGVAVVTAGPGSDRRAHRRGERQRRQLAAHPPRRRRAAVQPEPGQPPGDGAGGPLPPDLQVVGPGALAGPHPALHGQGVPGGAERTAGAGVPRARLGRALQRRGRGRAADPPPVPDAGAAGSGPAGGGRGAGLARRRRAPGDDCRLERVLGRRSRRAPGLRGARADSHLPQRRGPRAASRPTTRCSSSTPGRRPSPGRTWCS